MKMKKKVCFLCGIFITGTFLFAEPKLEDYLSNDLELQRLALEVKKAQLNSKKANIENGIDIQLSTGKATLQFTGDSSTVKFSPNATISIPQASNLSINVSSSVSLNSETTNNSVKDTSLSLSIDILSGNSISRKISLMKAERSLLEAKRKLQNYLLTAENNYYKELLNLYELSSKIISAQKDMYDDTIDFDKIKAQGYAKSSAKYRQAEMKVLSDKHEVETKIHNLEHECAVFASKCNTTYDSAINPKDFIPSEIPDIKELDILSFAKESYSKIENAEYEHTLADLTRKADKNFTLSASSGYTFNNSDTKSTSSSSEQNTTTSANYSDTIDVGLDMGWNGLNLDAGVSIPTDGNLPVYTLSASINPGKFLTASIKNKTNELNEQEELIAIQSAKNSYDDDVVDMQSELNDIKWSTETNKETYDMYVSLETDLQNYLKAGVITESEYLNSFANKELYRIKMIIDKINLIIYNNEIKLLFCRDDEINL